MLTMTLWIPKPIPGYPVEDIQQPHFACGIVERAPEESQFEAWLLFSHKSVE